ncbi:hypothetical protein [Pseudomonas phage Pa2]|uniref:Uncharacterized protein n=1 Tax=Pseudomonas phage Pa2 TaxID=1530400 RepID=A0A346CM66_9CAUD|nr:hypothetical protein ACQ21_p09 [Pseudomonas phage Pa2]AXL96690.1 hypothetical protein [Pseudomonas phage Pa2]
MKWSPEERAQRVPQGMTRNLTPDRGKLNIQLFLPPIHASTPVSLCGARCARSSADCVPAWIGWGRLGRLYFDQLWRNQHGRHLQHQWGLRNRGLEWS